MMSKHRIKSQCKALRLHTYKPQEQYRTRVPCWKPPFITFMQQDYSHMFSFTPYSSADAKEGMSVNSSRSNMNKPIIERQIAKISTSNATNRTYSNSTAITKI
ncbi:hypothetical protein Ancab_034462 [Ancistrocladus abbreviatus]